LAQVPTPDDDQISRDEAAPHARMIADEEVRVMLCQSLSDDVSRAWAT